MGDARGVYFPLASNAHSLLTGSPLESVRRRIKLASLLHDEVFLESGTMQIQAGPTGAIAMRKTGSDDDARWQTPAERASLQGNEFVLSLGPTGAPHDSTEMQQVMQSRSAIAWYPTFEPFRHELPSSASWVQVGQFPKLTPEEKARGKSWRRRDDTNAALSRRLNDALVRNQVLGSVENDILLATARGVGLSLDHLHAAVLGSRLVDPRLRVRGFALPVLVPRAGEMSWSDLAEVRKHKSMVTLRAVLNDIERDVLNQVTTVGEVPDAVYRRYRGVVERFALDTPSVGSAIGLGIADIFVGGVIGFATAGLGWIGTLVGAAPAVGQTAYDAVGRVRDRRKRNWISALQSIEHKAG